MELYQALITLDGWTFLAQICNLMIQLVIFKKFLLKPIKQVIADRKAKADSEIADAQKLRTEAEAMKAEYEQNLQNARTEANQIVAAAQKTATARSEEIVGEARAQAAALKQKAEADIAQERKKAVNEVKDEIGGIAMEIASKVVEREISEKDHKDLIDEFIKNVIAERKAKADSQIADATKLRTEAEAMKAEYEQNLQNARAEANQIVARAQKTATARGEEIVGEARAQAAALKQKAEADIAQERKKAVNEAKDEIGGMAMEIASKVVEREIKEADHKDLIDEFIKNVGEAS